MDVAVNTDKRHKDVISPSVTTSLEAAELATEDWKFIWRNMAARIDAEPCLKKWVQREIDELQKAHKEDFHAAEQIAKRYTERGNVAITDSVLRKALEDMTDLASHTRLLESIMIMLSDQGKDALNAREFKNDFDEIDDLTMCLTPGMRLAFVSDQISDYAPCSNGLDVKLDRKRLSIMINVIHNKVYKDGVHTLYDTKIGGYTAHLIESQLKCGHVLQSSRGDASIVSNCELGAKFEADIADIVEYRSLVHPIRLGIEYYDFKHTGYCVPATPVPSAIVLAAEILLRPTPRPEIGDKDWNAAGALQRAAREIWPYWRTKVPTPVKGDATWEDMMLALFDPDYRNGPRAFVLPSDYAGGDAQLEYARSIKRDVPGLG
jgi:hypothetical protein